MLDLFLPLESFFRTRVKQCHSLWLFSLRDVKNQLSPRQKYPRKYHEN